ncbi:hypothetical protein Zmor_027539 [Zophobas morio]|uniref:beta-glucosidase n=1 Tax=Zophobas morio TaxID=2755281 RepID=A0AA38HNH0_9CUCU|nr:hypothetical protein Zmor_027539 [Zophobas morio]
MSARIILVWCYVFVLCCANKTLKFPDGFRFGVATAAYQVEGGWNASGKGENIWDRLTHSYPDLITDHSTGDVACDSYDLWNTDIKLLKYLNVDYYRFSLSWSRLLPSGFATHVNPDGVRYYNNLIDGLLSNGIAPVVTLYHWDLPQPLQDLGGWTNPLIADYFEDFARVAFGLFGDRVKAWITINEPASICVGTYENGEGAPAYVESPGIGLYLCGKTILLAHAKAYRLYDNEFRHTQYGIVGITIDSIWAEPKTNSTVDVIAAEREMQFGLGWWANPIFSASGDYPEIMKVRIAENSKRENFTKSRLPALNPSEVKLIQGTFDFFGLNHYHTWLIADHEYQYNRSSYQKDKGTLGTQNPDWKPTPEIVPWGFRKLLNWVKTQYNNPLVVVTENGFGDAGGLKDRNRVIFLYGFMKALLLSILEDNCNVKGYTVWSIMDNMEWRSGFTVKFGLFDVNFTDPRRQRTPKASAEFYRHVIQTRVLPEK